MVDKFQDLRINELDPQRIWQVFYAKIRVQVEKKCSPAQLDMTLVLCIPNF